MPDMDAPDDGLIDFGTPGLTMAVYCDGPRALTDTEFPPGDRIRALPKVATPPEVYDALADEVQGILASRELYRGMAAGYELRIETFHAMVRDLRGRIEMWRREAKERRIEAQGDDVDDVRGRALMSTAAIYVILARQIEEVIGAPTVRTPSEDAGE
jgi:hypothetical protein